MLRDEITSFDWYLWFLWTLATAFGWTISAFFSLNSGAVIAGIAIRILQWLVLQRRLIDAWKWSIAQTSGGH